MRDRFPPDAAVFPARRQTRAREGAANRDATARRNVSRVAVRWCAVVREATRETLGRKSARGGFISFSFRFDSIHSRARVVGSCDRSRARRAIVRSIAGFEMEAIRAADGDARRDKDVDEDVDEDVVAALALEFGGGDGAGGDLNAHEWSKDEWRLDPGMFDVMETGTTGGSEGKAGISGRGGGEGNARGGTASAEGSRRGKRDDSRVCEVDGCRERRSAHRGAGLCDKHRHAESFVMAEANGGKPMRWCFYCHRAHDLGAFSSVSRSICHEKFTLRQGRRKAKKSAEAKHRMALGNNNVTYAPEGGDRGTSELNHQTQTRPQGLDVKFWVAHPKELQERTDMWDLVRRLNSPEDPVGMYGTIVPGCVRLTVCGWIAAESEVLRLDERVRAAFDAETTSKCAVLSGPISVCEMTSARRKSGRVDADGGVIQRTRECESHAPIDCPIFASAREEVTIRDLNMFPEKARVVRFFSEYVDREVSYSDVPGDDSASVDPLADSSTGVIDHVISVQIGGYGASYEHIGVIEDTEIARELMSLDAATTGVENRARLRDFALDYVWLSNRVESARLFRDEDLRRAYYIASSAVANFQRLGHMPNASRRAEMLRDEISSRRHSVVETCSVTPIRSISDSAHYVSQL